MVVFQRVFRLVVLLVLFLMPACPQQQTNPPAHQPPKFNDPNLTPLLPEFDWPTWYYQHSGYPPDSNWFGFYTILPVNNSLYLGIGSSRPAEKDGALIAQIEGTEVKSLGTLTEQGVHEMLWTGNTLHIAGTDPCCPDSWDAGNHYTLTPPESIIKHRDPVAGLTNVIHTWGLWNAGNNQIIAAVSSQQNDGEIRMGQIMSTEDQGVTWQHLSDLGAYRAYDIHGMNEALYALAVDGLGMPAFLSRSQDGGKKWNSVGKEEWSRIKFIRYQENLVGTSFDRTAILTVQEEAVQTFPLPPNRKIGISFTDVPTATNHNMLVVAHNRVFTVWERTDAISATYEVVSTADFKQWDVEAITSEELVSIAHWPVENMLIFAGISSSTHLWLLPLPPLTTYLYFPLIIR